MAWRVGKKLQWFDGTVVKRHRATGRDKDGAIVYVDIKWDSDNTISRSFKLFEDYFEKEIESGWKLLSGDGEVFSGAKIQSMERDESE